MPGRRSLTLAIASLSFLATPALAQSPPSGAGAPANCVVRTALQHAQAVEPVPAPQPGCSVPRSHSRTPQGPVNRAILLRDRSALIPVQPPTS